MTVWSCATCGVEHPDTDQPPAGTCVICADERQYVPRSGQRWISQAELSAQPYELEVREIEPSIHGLHREPEVAIGQWSYLVRTEAGNLLWDPPNHLDERTADRVRELGGVTAIAASHPHMFGAQVSWSHLFGSVPVWVNAADRRWVQRADPVITQWSGNAEILPGLTLLQLGGHFPGSAAAHWQHGAGGEGALLSGDTIAGVADPDWVTFLRSYPNRIPLSAAVVGRIVDRLAGYRFETLLDLGGRVIGPQADRKVAKSGERYIGWVRGDFDGNT
ncbi:MBL fold metallo-hydrolase [Actinocatenispora comari]|uniref:Hydrolase n=1 Tax=Actinocatenispora comari TaxID=2807577 RepID=A0A8J4EHW5_9ACTN|nr:MBL fold metallo-hydrolase [Actinocatenispora comari]GIL25462.1 hydrolase [Actinocatenispora comari]